MTNTYEITIDLGNGYKKVTYVKGDQAEVIRVIKYLLRNNNESATYRKIN